MKRKIIQSVLVLIMATTSVTTVFNDEPQAGTAEIGDTFETSVEAGSNSSDQEGTSLGEESDETSRSDTEGSLEESQVIDDELSPDSELTVDPNKQEEIKRDLTQENRLETLSVTPFSQEISTTEIIVYTFSELKNLIQTSGSHSYTTYYLGDNIIGLVGGILVPNGYSFTIVGRNPQTGTRYTYNEYRSASISDTIRHIGALPSTMTMRDLDINGKNYYGTLYGGGSNSNSVHVFDNVNYIGPQITHNIGGSVVYKDSILLIEQNGGPTAAQEVAEVRNVTFRGHVEIYHTENTAYYTFLMGASLSMHFAEDSDVYIKTNTQLMDVSANQTIYFEASSKLVLDQNSALSTAQAFYMTGTASTFYMAPGSVLDIDRTNQTNSTGQILYTSKVGMIDIDGGSIRYRTGGNQSGTPILNANTVTIHNGASIDVNIGGNYPGRVIDANNFTGFYNSQATVTVGGVMSTDTTGVGIFDGGYNKPMTFENSIISINATSVSRNIIRSSTLTIKNSIYELNVSASLMQRPNNTSINEISGSTLKVIYPLNTNSEPLFSATGQMTLTNVDVQVNVGSLRNNIFSANTITIENTMSKSIEVKSATSIGMPLMQTPNIGTIKNGNIKIESDTIDGLTPLLVSDGSGELSDLTLNNTEISVSANSINKPVYKGRSLYVTDSSLKINSQSVNSVQIQAFLLYGTNSDVEIKSPNANSDFLITLTQLNQSNTRVVMDTQSGSLISALSISGGTAVIDNESKLVMIAPQAKSMIYAGIPAQFTINSNQANLWNTADISQNPAGLDVLPDRRYVVDSNGTTSFRYMFNGNGTDVVENFSTNLVSQQDGSMVDTFSLITSQTKGVSFGSFAVEIPEVSFGSTLTTGTAPAGSHVRLNYISNAIEQISSGFANTSGVYSLLTQPVNSGTAKFSVYSDYLYSAKSDVEIAETGSLRFGTMPETLVFGQHAIPTTRTTLNRSGAMTLQIIDDRTSGIGWKLEVIQLTPIKDKDGLRPNINGSLVFKTLAGNTIELIEGEKVIVAQSDNSTPIDTVLEYAANQGILMEIMDGSNIYINTEYTTSIQWVLTDRDE